MDYVLAAIVGLVLGAADQYLGTMLWLGAWTSTAAQLSAPWLLLPFAVGMTQDRPRKAMLLGLVATAAALFGYFAMTYSPMEVHPWSVGRFARGLGAVASSGYNPAYILGGLITAPMFGLLGQRWRLRRWWVSAVVVGGVLCLEPLVRLATGQLPYAARNVWWIEVAVGVTIAMLFTFELLRRRNTAPHRVSS